MCPSICLQRISGDGYLSEYLNHNGNNDDEARHVRYRGGKLNTQEAKERTQNEQGRNEHEALPGGGDEACFHCHAHGLSDHIAHCYDARERKADAVEPERPGADSDHVGIIPAELGHNLGGEDRENNGGKKKAAKSDTDAEPKGLFDPVVEFRSVVEPADWLETLAETEHHRVGKHYNAVNN